jgi:hypothetical protein
MLKMRAYIHNELSKRTAPTQSLWSVCGGMLKLVATQGNRNVMQFCIFKSVLNEVPARSPRVHRVHDVDCHRLLQVHS